MVARRRGHEGEFDACKNEHISVYAAAKRYDVPRMTLSDRMLGKVGETGASCYRGRLLQGRFMPNYHIDGEIADSGCIRIHQGNH